MLDNYHYVLAVVKSTVLTLGHQMTAVEILQSMVALKVIFVVRFMGPVNLAVKVAQTRA